MKKHKRIMCLLLSAIILICMMPVMSMAETLPKEHCDCIYINSKGDIVSQPKEGDYSITLNSWYEDDEEDNPVYLLDNSTQKLSLVFKEEEKAYIRRKPENGHILISQYRRSETGKLKWIDCYDRNIENIISSHLSYSWQYYNEENDKYTNIAGANQSSFTASAAYISDKDKVGSIKATMQYDGTYVDCFYFLLEKNLSVKASIAGNGCVEKGQKVTLTANVTTNAPDPKAVKYSYSWYSNPLNSWDPIELGNEASITIDATKFATVYLNIDAEYENYNNYCYDEAELYLLPYEDVGMLTEQQGVSFSEKHCDDTNNVKCITFKPEKAGVYEFVYGSPYTWICDVLDSNNEPAVHCGTGYYDAANHSFKIRKLKEKETYRIIAVCDADNFPTAWSDTITVKQLSECDHMLKKIVGATNSFAGDLYCAKCGIFLEQGMRVVAKSKTLPLKVKQSIGAGKNLSYNSGDAVASVKTSNTNVVSVSKTTIKGKKVGKAQISVTMKSGLKTTFTVNVKKTDPQASSITTKVGSTIKLKKGKKVSIGCIVLPVTCKDKVSYSTDNKKIATVSSKGQITAKKKGTAKIKIKCGNKTKTITVKVS